MSDFVIFVLGGLVTVGVARLFRSSKAVAMVSFRSRDRPGVEGTVRIVQESRSTLFLECRLKGLAPNGVHGFHVHEFGDLSKLCDSLGDHYNPLSKFHGGVLNSERHVGDLGNLVADESGNCNMTIRIPGKLDHFYGRSLVIHANEDDLGKKATVASKQNGTSGARIACGIIGRAAVPKMLDS